MGGYATNPSSRSCLPTPGPDGYAGSPFFMGSHRQGPSHAPWPIPVPWFPILASEHPSVFGDLAATAAHGKMEEAGSLVPPGPSNGAEGVVYLSASVLEEIIRG